MYENIRSLAVVKLQVIPVGLG